MTVRHGTDETGLSARSVLVGSLSVRARTRWQRFVGMWRMWGLFSRRVRFIAAKPGDDASSPVGDSSAGPMEPLPERGLDADGNDPLEF